MPKMSRKYATILNIRVNSTSTAQVLRLIRYFLANRHKFYIVTPNPELVLMAQKDSYLKDALNDADIAVPDGVGLDIASRFLFGKPLNIIPGRKLFLDLIELANQKGWRVFLLGGESDEAQKATENIKLNYKRVSILSLPGPNLTEAAESASEVDRNLEKETFSLINEFRPQLLFVAFGNPKQEIWLHKNINKLDIGGAMAVGGTFRYLAGYSKLPPKWMEKVGLEWLWRAVTEPRRLKRIIRAAIYFPLQIVLERFRG